VLRSSQQVEFRILCLGFQRDFVINLAVVLLSGGKYRAVGSFYKAGDLFELRMFSGFYQLK